MKVEVSLYTGLPCIVYSCSVLTCISIGFSFLFPNIWHIYGIYTFFADHHMKVPKKWGITDGKEGSGENNVNILGRTVWRLKRLIVDKRWREIDQDKKVSKWLIQSIPKMFLTFIYAEGRQKPKRTILINEFLAICCTILFNRHQRNLFTFCVYTLFSGNNRCV